ncbi:MAG TPA: DUF202 domain-containing protein [archaeon]|nr:DUF202 domain-containing protein [archaeon]
MPAKRPRKSSRKRKHHPRKHNKEHKLSQEEERTLFLKEQTILAKERTILSFMRTGLGFITAGFAIIAATGILQNFFSMHPLTPSIIGWALVGVGFLEIIESFRRLRTYRDKMKKIKVELGDEDI